MPQLQTPALQVSPSGAQLAPAPLSSTVPLQSSSRPLQVSTVEPVLSVQTTPMPLGVHTNTPSLHRSVSAPSQAWPRVGKSSSTAPSQSSSRPLHFSTVLEVLSVQTVP